MFQTPSSWDKAAPASSYKMPSKATHYDSSDDFDEEEKVASGAKAVGARAASGGSFSVADRGSTLSSSHSITALNKHKNKNSFGLDAFLLCGAIKTVLDSEKQSVIVVSR